MIDPIDVSATGSDRVDLASGRLADLERLSAALTRDVRTRVSTAS